MLFKIYSTIKEVFMNFVIFNSLFLPLDLTL